MFVFVVCFVVFGWFGGVGVFFSPLQKTIPLFSSEGKADISDAVELLLLCIMLAESFGQRSGTGLDPPSHTQPSPRLTRGDAAGIQGSLCVFRNHTSWGVSPIRE